MGWMTPYYGGRGVMTLWIPQYYSEKIYKTIIKHELQHLKCWREEGNKGYNNNFVKHKGCFENK